MNKYAQHSQAARVAEETRERIKQATYGCARKRRYRNRTVALEVAAKCRDLRGTPLRPYACPFCGQWHLTKKGAKA